MAYPVSAAFKAAIKGSHAVATKIDITDPLTQQVLYNLTTITEGQMTEDRDQSARRQAQFSAVDVDGSLTPDTAKDLLMPFGNEFRPYCGIVLPSGEIEYVPQGVFEISDTDINDSGDNLLISCSGKDRSVAVGRAGFADTFATATGQLVADAAQDILDFIGVNYPTKFDINEYEIARKVYNIGDDPWKALLELFTSCGCNVFFDQDGVLVSSPLRNYIGVDFDWEIKDGVEGNLLAASRRIQRNDDVANYIVVTGEHADNTTTIPTGIAIDEDPTSPTYAYGKYGIVFKHVTSNTIKTDTAAQAMADHILGESLGLSEDVTAYLIPNPAMQVDDLIRFNRAKSKLVDADVVLDQVSIPFIAQRNGQAISKRRAIAA